MIKSFSRKGLEDFSYAGTKKGDSARIRPLAGNSRIEGMAEYKGRERIGEKMAKGFQREEGSALINRLRKGQIQ